MKLIHNFPCVSLESPDKLVSPQRFLKNQSSLLTPVLVKSVSEQSKMPHSIFSESILVHWAIISGKSDSKPNLELDCQEKVVDFLQACLLIHSIVIGEALHHLLLFDESNDHLVSSLGFYETYSLIDVGLADLSVLVPTVQA